MGAENLAPTRIRSLDSPARSESLYRLSYPGPLTFWQGQKIPRRLVALTTKFYVVALSTVSIVMPLIFVTYRRVYRCTCTEPKSPDNC